MFTKTTQQTLHNRASVRKLALLPLVLLLASCNNLNPTKEVKTDSDGAKKLTSMPLLREPKEQSAPQSYTAPDQGLSTQFKSGPGVNISNSVADTQTRELTLNIPGQPINSVNYHDMPLPEFINEVYGNTLGQAFSLDPQIQKQTDLVSLRIPDPVSPSELFRIANRTLAAYGVAVSQQDKVLSFSIDKSANSGEIPLLVSGRTLPDVPESHRPVFMFVQLKAVSNNKVASWVTAALSGMDIKVTEDSVRNAVMISGKPDVVRQALAIIDVLDQPLMRGKFSTSIEPAFTKATDLSKNLKDVLNAEGYDANIKSSSGSIMIIPLEGTNQLIVFAGSQAILDHVRDWVNTLDRRQQMSIDQGIFTYEVRNAEAGHIAELLNGLENGTGTSSASSPSRTGLDSKNATGSAVSDTVATSGSASTGATSGKVNGGNLAVDSSRNTIVFKGSGQAWADLLPVIQSLDKPSPSVLIEVLLAEVNLDDSENSGVDFVSNGTATNNGAHYLSKLTTTTRSNFDSLPSSMAFTLNSAGATNATLNLFQKNNRVEVRSHPRLMVKSGETASIDVGDEIPIATGSFSSNVTGASPGTQTNFTYRKTGVRLTVKPVVHASGNVDIDIDQSLSQAGSGSGSNPPILNREIKTMVTLKDGGSVLLAGLISKNKSKGRAGVPWASNIPLLGKLFRTDTKSSSRTELMIMVIPYVIESPTEGENITKTIQDSFLKAE